MLILGQDVGLKTRLKMGQEGRCPVTSWSPCGEGRWGCLSRNGCDGGFLGWPRPQSFKKAKKCVAVKPPDEDRLQSSRGRKPLPDTQGGIGAEPRWKTRSLVASPGRRPDPSWLLQVEDQVTGGTPRWKARSLVTSPGGRPDHWWLPMASAPFHSSCSDFTI